jgi:molybdopterin converting factor small subunit
MKVTVKYYGHLKHQLGAKESYSFASEGQPYLLSDIMEGIFKRKGNVFADLIYCSGKFHPHISVILNGNVVQDTRTEIAQDCSLFFIPFVEGG